MEAEESKTRDLRPPGPVDAVMMHFWMFALGIAFLLFLKFGMDVDNVFSHRDIIRRRTVKRMSAKTSSDKTDSGQWVKKPARTLIDRPDTHLDALIAAGSIDEARKYRISMEKMSREMMDEHSLRNYRIYEEVIEDRQKELDAKRQPVPAISPMTIPVPAPAIIPRIAEKTAGPAVPEEKPAPREIQVEETQTSINPGDYTELIEL